MSVKRYAPVLGVIAVQLCIYCAAVNIFAVRYYRLLESERKVYLGLKGIDSLAAVAYIGFKTTAERTHFYENYWQGREEERQQFEERSEYAYRVYGQYAPLADDRIQIYVKYGPPSKREEIIPQKKIAIRTREAVKPAEVWTYKKYGVIYDFVRFARAYKVIARSEFGETVKVPFLNEVASDTTVQIEPATALDFEVTFGGFRQKRNLTRLEVYLSVELDDTTDLVLARTVKVFDKNNNLVDEERNLMKPENAAHGIFYDQVNFWLAPQEYRCDIELIDIKNRRSDTKSLVINLIDYLDDAKEISDLVPAYLIDDVFTHEKFNKPVGRMIPLTWFAVPVYKPFYFYAEVYNLETKNGMHQIRTTYEVYNKEKMRKEIVDVMIKDQVEAGDNATLAALYHPMDLNPGHYIMVLKVADLVSGRERAAICEFELQALE